jgi:hypothetical protein
MKKWFLLFLLSCSYAFATYIGNPASCYYFRHGLLGDSQWVDFRASFVYDNIYKVNFYKKYVDVLEIVPLKLEMRAAFLSLGIGSHMDLYGIVGSAQEKIDGFYSQENFCWGGGARFCFFHMWNFAFSGDGRYFQAALKPKYALEQNIPLEIMPPFHFLYQEIQGAFTISYDMGIFLPYIGPYYLYSRNDPIPFEGLLRVPGIEELQNFQLNRMENKKKWGILIGGNLISEQKFDITLEGRFIAQNAVSIAAEVRF